MEDELKDIINSCQYIVDAKLLNYFDSKWATGNYSSRLNVEAEAMEFILKDSGVLSVGDIVEGERYQWRHDAIYKSMIIDFKRRPKWSNKISFKHKQAKKSYELGELTHIVSYTSNIEQKLNIGDNLTFSYDRSFTIPDALKMAVNQGSYSFLPVMRY